MGGADEAGWYKNIKVRVPTDPQRRGDVGVVRDVNHTDMSCAVQFGDAEPVSIPMDRLEGLPPANNQDPVVIVRGDYKGMTGSLISIDKSECIVKVDQIYDVHIFNLPDLRLTE